MIKYADRGLVSNGLNLELYKKLFWICSGIFLLLYHAILLAMNLSEDNFIEKTITGSLCCDPSKPLSLSKYFTENSKNIVLRVSFVSFNMGYSLILYLNVKTSRNILKSNSNRVKAQIGIFRRNILTLKETILVMFVATLLELTRIVMAHYALTNQERGGADFRTTIYVINIILNLLIHDIIIGVILPCKVVYNMEEEVPELTSVSEPIDSFSARPLQLTPRRDVEMFEIDQPRPHQQRNRHYFSYLPPVNI